jgi:hypothetical protein
MKEAIPLLIVGLLFGAIGWWTGYNEGKKLPCEDVVLEEISQLQKDIMQCRHDNMVVLIRLVYLEDWRDSILFRPPNPLFEKEENDK